MRYLLIPFLISISLLTAQENVPISNFGGSSLDTYGSYLGEEQYVSEGAQQVIVDFEENVGEPKNIQHPNATDFVIPEGGLYLVGYKIQLQNFDEGEMFASVIVSSGDGSTNIPALTTSYDIPTTKTRNAVAQMLVHLEANTVLQVKVGTPLPTGGNGLGVFEPGFYLIKIGG